MPRHTRSEPRGSARLRLGLRVLVPLLMLGGALAATGCGESKSPPSAAATNSTPAASSTAAASSTTTAPPAGTASTPAATSTASPTAPPGTSTAGSSGAGAGHGHSRAHLVLPPPGSHPEPKLSASQAATLPVADIALSSTAIQPKRGSSQYTIAREYTCHGADRSLPLHWTGIPANTKELALFVLSVTPVAGKLVYDWALAGLNPKLAGLQAGQLPPGAIQGRTATGKTSYSLCPPAGKPESYVIQLYALPESLDPKPGFQPATLHQQAKHTAHHTGLLAGTYG